MALSDLFTRLRQDAFGTSAEGGTDAPIKPTKARWRLISIDEPVILRVRANPEPH